MSTRESFVSVYDLRTNRCVVIKDESPSQRSSTQGLPLGRLQQCSEEARQQQAYRAYMQDMNGSFHTDQRMENDFFGRRQLSISDFDGTRTIVTPTTSPKNEYHPRTDSRIRSLESAWVSHPMLSDLHLIGSEATHMMSALENLPQSMNDFYFANNHNSPSRSSGKFLHGPLCSLENLESEYYPITATTFQQQVDMDEPLSNLSSPTSSMYLSCSPPYTQYRDGCGGPLPLAYAQYRDGYGRSLSQSHTPTSPPYSRDYEYPQAAIAPEEIFESIESDSVCEYEEQSDHHNYMVCSHLRRFIDPDAKHESSSIRNVGFVDSPIEIHDDLPESAYAQSQCAAISEISTPALSPDHDIDDLESVSDIQLGYDASPGTIHFFSQAGVHVTTRDLQDDFIAAQSTNLQGGCLDIDQAAEDEKYRANADFFAELGCLRTTASSQDLLRLGTTIHHPICIDSPEIKPEYPDLDTQSLIPSIVDDLADPDYYLGPGAPAPDDSIFDKLHYARHVGDQVLQDLDLNQQPAVAKFGQAPFKESALIKRRTNRASKNAIRPSQQLLPATTFGQATKRSVVPFTNNILSIPTAGDSILMPVPISKAPNYGTSFLITKKRSARESFDLIDLCDENARRESSHKKARLTPNLTPDFARLPSTPSPSLSAFTGSPMATALEGYPGQFELHLPAELTHTKHSNTKHVFGNHLHANGEIINLHYTPDPYSAAAGTTTTTTDLSDCPGLSTTIEHANLHHTFAEEMPRSSDEEALRREAHRECAAARLEGVPVGYYRYFAGHMTVEEYVEARMCVCWGGCFCNRLCTHFGDLACPCVEGLVIGEEA